MGRIIRDRGVQAAAASAVALGALTVVFADRYPAAWVALWAVWAVVTTVATVRAARRVG